MDESTRAYWNEPATSLTPGTSQPVSFRPTIIDEDVGGGAAAAGAGEAAAGTGVDLAGQLIDTSLAHGADRMFTRNP